MDRGMYVCRTLSFKGAEFSIGEVPLESKMQVGSQALFLYSTCVLWVAYLKMSLTRLHRHAHFNTASHLAGHVL